MRTYSPKADEINREWIVVDLDGQTLGRAASAIARVLRGKHRPTYTPHMDTGAFVVAVNAGKIKLTGRKLEDKQYHWHSGYPGGIRTATADELLRLRPGDLLKIAVKGMLPKTHLGRKLLKKLKVYAEAEHPHAAQQPRPIRPEEMM